MTELFEVRDIDRAVYRESLADFLPDRFIDAHTHVWKDEHCHHDQSAFERVVSWPARVAKDNTVEDLVEGYRLLFPGKTVTPLMFSSIYEGDDMALMNGYVSDCAAARGFPALVYAHPTWTGKELEQRIRKGRFIGAKVYLNLAPSYLPRGEIRIFDFLPPHQLDVLDRNRGVAMLHIPRDGRLRDPVNIAQMLEIEKNWPRVRLIIAHVGRAYCDEDVGDAFQKLSASKRMVFDFSANTNDRVFEGALRAFGPERCLFGSDMPITRMRMRRICEGGRYINVVPRGMYGDVSADKNMREVDAPEADRLTFFMYEEVLAVKRAMGRIGLGRSDVEAFFLSNAKRVLEIAPMHTPWIPERQLRATLQRNEAFWTGELEEGPLLWVTASAATPGTPPVAPPTDEEQWTDVGYQIAKTEDALSRTRYPGDALPIHNPWLGPDQFAAWLGGELSFSTKDNTSWTRPFIEDWADHRQFRIDPDNRWWRTYIEILRASVEQGRDRWVTAYPDLHSGIDGLGAMRGPERLMMDLLSDPLAVKRAMQEMTRLWKEIIDTVSDIVLPAGQGTTNWTLGWSEKRFVCVGQNDFSCLISPAMFDEFVLADTAACCAHVDSTIYHLDGPGALQHVPRLLEIERLDCVQWIQGAGKPLPSEWVELLRRIQGAGKTVQLMYAGAHGGNADFRHEIDVLCTSLDPSRLFIAADVDSIEKADFIVRHAAEVCRERRSGPR